MGPNVVQPTFPTNDKPPNLKIIPNVKSIPKTLPHSRSNIEKKNANNANMSKEKLKNDPNNDFQDKIAQKIIRIMKQ